MVILDDHVFSYEERELSLRETLVGVPKPEWSGSGSCERVKNV